MTFQTCSMCKTFSSVIWTHSHTLLICTHVATKTSRSGTSIRRARGREIYVERVPSVAYLYQLCPGLVIQSQIAARLSASRHLKYPGRNVRARDCVITCCVGTRRELGFGLPFCLQRASIDHWSLFFLSLAFTYELGNRK